MPIRDPSRLVRIGRTLNGEQFMPFSYAELRDFTEGAPSLAGVLGEQPQNVLLGAGDDVRQEWMEVVTSNYFSLLGVPMSRGTVLPENGERDPQAVVVLSYGLWRARFAADSGIVGRTVRVNGHPFTVVGVARDGFTGTFTGFNIGLWVPAGMLAQALPGQLPLADRHNRFLMSFGRLAPGASLARARVELTAVAARWPTEPSTRGGERTGVDVREASGVHPLIATITKAFFALMTGIVGLVLLVACANVANLMLARGAGRRREMAMRLSLGATRMRLAQQLLTEGAVLAALGGAAGTLLAIALCRLLVAFHPAVGIPIALDVQVDFTVLVFAAVVSVGTTLAFGLAPVRQAMRTDINSVLKGSAGRAGRSRTASVLVAVQVAVSTILLVGSALLSRSLLNSRFLSPGFDSTHALVISPEPGLLGYSEERTRALWGRLTTRLEALPRVEAVTLALMIPLGSRGDQMAVAPTTEESSALAQHRMYGYNLVSPRYFSAMRIGLRAGREFLATDAAHTPDVAIVSETMAKRFWPAASALGQRVRVFDRADVERDAEVVGVVRDVSQRSLGATPEPFIYLPSAQWFRADMRLQIHSSGDPHGLAPAVRAAVRETDPELPTEVTMLEEETAFARVPIKVAGVVFTAAGAIGLFLAVIGVFGVVSYTVAQQTREIGIRMALGARSAQVGGMVLRHGMRMTALGIAVGLVAAAGAARLLRGLLYGVGVADPLSYAAAALLFAVVSALACYVPARRASRVAPAVALRGE